MMADCPRNRILSGLILLTAAVVFFIMADAIGLYHDDFLYRTYFPPTDQLDWLGGARHNHTLTDALESYANHYRLWDNARIANLVAFIFALLPEWTSDIISALCLAITLWWMSRLSAGRAWRSSPLTVAGVFLTFFLLMPLRDSMLSTVHLQNYLWTSAVALPFMGVILDPHTTLSSKRMIPLTAWGIIAGVMHEGFTTEWGCGLLAWLAITLLCHRKPVPQKAFLAGVFLIASLYLLLSPATGSRIEESVKLPASLVSTIAHGLLFDFRYLPLLIATLAVACVRKGISCIISDGVIVTFTTAALIAPVVSILTQSPPGASWPGAAGAVIVIWRLASPHVSAIRHGTVYAVAITVLCSLWLLSIASIQRHYTAAADRLEKILTVTDGNIIYLDMPTRTDSPWWTDSKLLSLTDHDIPYTLFHNYYRGGTPHRSGDIYIPVAVFPQRYKDLPLDSLPAINGSAHLKGVYPFFIGPIVADTAFVPIDITFSTVAPPDRNATSPVARAYNTIRYGASPTVRKHTEALVRKMRAPDGDTIGLYFPFVPFLLTDYPIVAIDHNFDAAR